MAVSVSLVETTRPEELTTAATNLSGKVAQLNSTIDTQRNALRDLQGGWEGEASQAALARAERDLAKQTGFRDRLAQAQQILQTGGTHLAQTRSALLGIVNTLRGQGWQVSDNGVATPPATLPQVLKGTATAWTAIVQRLLTTFGEIDKQTAGSLPKFSPLSVDEPLFVGGDKKQDLPSENERRRNQIEAFKEVYGREPVTQNDWTMAEILDPTSYNEMNAGRCI
jgi:WXG100 family type VII secretion target